MSDERLLHRVSVTVVMIDINPLQLGLELGGGGTLGFITGYAAKKIVKVIAVIIGVQLALFKFLETRGVLEVHWKRLYSTASNATRSAANATVGNQTGEATNPGGGILESFLSMLPVGGGFAAGVLVGFKMG